MGMVSGIAMDLIGRKPFVVVGLFVLAAHITTVPLFHSIYPWFFISKMLMYSFMSFAMSAPFAIDYIHKDSLGLF